MINTKFNLSYALHRCIASVYKDRAKIIVLVDLYTYMYLYSEVLPVTILTCSGFKTVPAEDRDLGKYPKSWKRESHTSIPTNLSIYIYFVENVFFF